jgi:TonB family protein
VHLVRALHFGRAEIDDVPVVYVVTELAEEVLSQIIPERPLTAEEARQMLEPVLDALSYLHANGLVHAHLKPSNILVIENEVKLSADGVIASGKPALGFNSGDVHNAPETAAEPVDPSADMWSLGITVVEALTQQLPVWDSAAKPEPMVPAAVPKPFGEIARECLQIDPARRCTISDVRALLAGKSQPVPARSPSAPASHVPEKIAERSSRARMPLVPLVVGLVLLIAIIIGLTMRSHKTQTAPLQTETTQQAPAAEPESQTPAPATATKGNAKGEVLNRVMPDVSRQASNTIHGTVSVAVRVNVDPSGTVTDAQFASHGPSAYFARIAMESARNWKFKAPMQNGQAVADAWLLHYKFRRDGVDVNPVEQ